MFSISSVFGVSGRSVVKIGIHVGKIVGDVGIFDVHVGKKRIHVGNITNERTLSLTFWRWRLTFLKERLKNCRCRLRNQHWRLKRAGAPWFKKMLKQKKKKLSHLRSQMAFPMEKNFTVLFFIKKLYEVHVQETIQIIHDNCIWIYLKVVGKEHLN